MLLLSLLGFLLVMGISVAYLLVLMVHIISSSECLRVVTTTIAVVKFGQKSG